MCGRQYRELRRQTQVAQNERVLADLDAAVTRLSDDQAVGDDAALPLDADMIVPLLSWVRHHHTPISTLH
jgi:hypothetical protein